MVMKEIWKMRKNERKRQLLEYIAEKGDVTVKEIMRGLRIRKNIKMSLYNYWRQGLLKRWRHHSTLEYVYRITDKGKRKLEYFNEIHEPSRKRRKKVRMIQRDFKKPEPDYL